MLFHHELKLERRIQALEIRCYRRILISYRDYITNEEVLKDIDTFEDFFTTVNKQIRGPWRQSRQEKRCEDNVKEWTRMKLATSQRAVENSEMRRDCSRWSYNQTGYGRKGVKWTIEVPALVQWSTCWVPASWSCNVTPSRDRDIPDLILHQIVLDWELYDEQIACAINMVWWEAISPWQLKCQWKIISSLLLWVNK